MRFGIIGAGCIGLEHIRNIRILEGSAVVAVADPHEGSLAAARELLAGAAAPVAYAADYHELLALPTVDALIICTPNYHHIEVLRAVLALNGGAAKHVLCEKPMCTTLADCLEVRGMVRQCGQEGRGQHRRLFWVGMEYRYIPAVRRLIAEVDAGTVGKLHLVTIREHRFPFLQKVGRWNRVAANTGDTLVEKCCHFFDLVCRIVGPQHAPSRVFASGGQSVNHLDEYVDGTKADILDNAYVIVEFDGGGPRMCLELCMFAEASKNQEELSVVGDRGKLEAFAPAHQMQAERGHPAPNVRVGLRVLPWVDRVLPPAPVPVHEFHEGADAKVLGAGYHEGATFFELQDFVEQAASSSGVGRAVHGARLAPPRAAACRVPRSARWGVLSRPPARPPSLSLHQARCPGPRP